MAGQLKEIRDLPSANDITVGGGDFLHIKQGDVDRKIRVQDLFKFHTTDYNNPHFVTKTQVGLAQVSNDLQLKQASNLADVPNKATARTNLSVYSKAESDASLTSHTSRVDNPHATTKAQVGLGNVVNSLQLQASSNLSDLPSKPAARTNLDVYSKSETQSVVNAHAGRTDNPHTVTKAQVGLSLVSNFTYSGDYNNSSHQIYATIGAVNSVYNILTSQYVKAARGMIIMWYGSTASIPAGWALCNGANGTPNLIDRFIVGAGSSYGLGSVGGAATVSHGHNGYVQGHALTEAQIPSHSHSIISGGGSSGPRQAMAIDSNSNTSHDWRGPYVGGVPATYATGGNQAHSHGLSLDGATTENRPPYYALFYIMKL